MPEVGDGGEARRGEATSTAPAKLRVPASLERYFWDYPTERLRAGFGGEAVIQRLLEAGGWDATCWLRTEVGEAVIRDHLVRRRGRGVAPKRLRFWALILGLPAQAVDEWIDAQRSNPWQQRVLR